MILYLILLLLTFVSLRGFCLAGLVNITIDATNYNTSGIPSIKFTPINAWQSQTSSSNTSWHEFSFEPGETSPIATLFFYGSAVYVYCIIVPLKTSDMSFKLDCVPVGQTSLSTTATPEKRIVFFNTTLPLGAEHTLVIQNGNPSSSKTSTIFLDSIIISSFDGSEISSSSSATQPGVIVGAVLGSLAVIPLVGLGYLFCLRRRQKQKYSAESGPPPPTQAYQEQQTCRWRSLTLPSIQRLNPVVIAQRLQLAQPVPTSRTAGSFQIDVSSRGGGVSQGNRPNHISSVPPSPWVVEPTQGLNRVQIWQQQTHEATRDVEMAPPDMSEELSSYYDDNATESQRYRPVTPPPPPRRFVIRNN